MLADRGNGWIEGGDGSILIHKGLGRNRVMLGKGNDTPHIGTGVTQVMAGKGDTVFVPAYGGVTLVDNWAAGQVCDFAAWPAKPQLTQHGDTAEFTRGLSNRRVLGVVKGADIAAQMRARAPE